MEDRHTLDERAIIRTLEVLRSRIAERFPTRGLTRTASHLLDLARVAGKEAADLREPNWGMRLIPLLAIAGAVAGFVVLYNIFSVITDRQLGLADFTQGLDATLNIILIAGIAIGFFSGSRTAGNGPSRSTGYGGCGQSAMSSTCTSSPRIRPQLSGGSAPPHRHFAILSPLSFTAISTTARKCCLSQASSRPYTRNISLMRPSSPLLTTSNS